MKSEKHGLAGKVFARVFEVKNNGHRVFFQEDYAGKFEINVSDIDGDGLHRKTVRLSRAELEAALSRAEASKEQTFPITVPDPVPGATRECKRNRTETVHIPCERLRKELERLDSLPPRFKG